MRARVESIRYRVIDSIDAAGLERLRDAVALARSRAWALGAAPKLVVLDFDARSALDKRSPTMRFRTNGGA